MTDFQKDDYEYKVKPTRIKPKGLKEWLLVTAMFCLPASSFTLLMPEKDLFEQRITATKDKKDRILGNESSNTRSSRRSSVTDPFSDRRGTDANEGDSMRNTDGSEASVLYEASEAPGLETSETHASQRRMTTGTVPAGFQVNREGSQVSPYEPTSNVESSNEAIMQYLRDVEAFLDTRINLLETRFMNFSARSTISQYMGNLPVSQSLQALFETRLPTYSDTLSQEVAPLTNFRPDFSAERLSATEFTDIRERIRQKDRTLLILLANSHTPDALRASMRSVASIHVTFAHYNLFATTADVSRAFAQGEITYLSLQETIDGQRVTSLIDALYAQLDVNSGSELQVILNDISGLLSNSSTRWTSDSQRNILIQSVIRFLKKMYTFDEQKREYTKSTPNPPLESEVLAPFYPAFIQFEKQSLVDMVLGITNALLSDYRENGIRSYDGIVNNIRFSQLVYIMGVLKKNANASVYDQTYNALVRMMSTMETHYTQNSSPYLGRVTRVLNPMQAIQ